MKSFLVVIVIITALAACTRHCQHNSVPACIQSTIDANKKNPDWEVENVKEYSYQGKIIYAFYPLSMGADMPIEIKDSNCTVICTLGGLMGKTDCNGENFDQKAIYRRTVWER